MYLAYGGEKYIIEGAILLVSICSLGPIYTWVVNKPNREVIRFSGGASVYRNLENADCS